MTEAAELKVLALSDIIREGVPRLAENRLKLPINVVVVRSRIKSRCTARVVQHVYKHSHTFEVSAPWSDVRTCRGPAKSTTVV